MPPAKSTYDLPSDAPSAILQEDSVESSFIGQTSGSGKPLTSCEAFNLATLRDTLQPNLLSGELSILAIGNHVP